MLGCMCGLTSLWLLPSRAAPSGAGRRQVFRRCLIAVAMELAVYRTLRRRRVPIINVITATVGMSILCSKRGAHHMGIPAAAFPRAVRRLGV